MTKQIGILGSMFDPPHWAHFLIAKRVVEKVPSIDEVWFMPVYKHHWKEEVAPAESRYKMAQILAGNTFYVSQEEMLTKKVNYTIDTTRSLKKKYTHTFYWIIGSDIVPELHKWGNVKQLLKEISFIIFPRVGFPLTDAPSGSIVVNTGVVKDNISSALIRKRVCRGQSIAGLVPERVATYIEENKLYR